MTSGFSVIIVAMKKGSAINSAKLLVGSTDPAKAKKGTIRSLSKDNKLMATKKGRVIYNFIHFSDKNNIIKEFEIIKPYLKWV